LVVRRVAHQADALSDDPRARRKRTIPREQLNLGLAGEADVVYGYSFILTDLPGETATVEHYHRDRAQIEERIKDAKLGVSLRRLPLSDLDASRVWLHCSALALNLLALLNDLMFGPEPPGHLPRRRQAKFVRRMLLCAALRSRPGHPPRPPDHPPATSRTAVRGCVPGRLQRRPRPRATGTGLTLAMNTPRRARRDRPWPHPDAIGPIAPGSEDIKTTPPPLTGRRRLAKPPDGLNPDPGRLTH